jgi:molybdate transport system ATP-binding protein
LARAVPDRRLTVQLRQDDRIPLDVEFACEAGDVLAVFGPSGSGKTTILRSIAGLYRPSIASVRSGADIWTDTAAGRFEPPHRRAVGFVFQEYALFPHLTAAENVAIALGHLPRDGRRLRADALLRVVHLSDKGNRRPQQLSGGERQRVALARALAREPAVLLLDEPFAAVDRPVRRSLQDEIDGIRRGADMPLVLVTHDFEDVARLATHVLLLERGRSVAYGPVAEVMSRPDLSWLREAVGLGALFDARVTERFPERRLIELSFEGGALLVAGHQAEIGSTIRVRIPAREVILATRAPENVSVHNVLSGKVSALHADPALDHAIVQVAVGGIFLLAEVTRDAIARLGIAVGLPIYALVKSMSVDLLGTRQPGR